MENDEKYLSPKAITKKYNITSNTLRNWSNQGKIDYIRPFGGKRFYSANSVIKIFNQKKNTKQRYRILYARVSSNHQKEDLERQIEYLQSTYPGDKVIKDIGSGHTWKRKGLETLLEQINEGLVSEIVVSYKDRLCRFGYELFEWICKKQNVKLVVLNHRAPSEDKDKELSEDLLSIITVFVAKNNGIRASKNKNHKNTVIAKQKTKEKT